MHSKNKIFETLIFLNLLIIISCSTKNNKESNIFNNESNSNELLVFEFPDTVKLGVKIKGVINYNLEFNSENSSEIKERFVFLYVTTDKSLLTLRDVKNGKHKAFVSKKRNGKIDFDVKFSNEKMNVLNCFIKDQIFFKRKNTDAKVRIKTREVNISKDVYVVDGGNVTE